MAAALVRGHRVDFVHDDCPRGRQHAAAALGSQKDVERFRRRHDDVGRTADHALAFIGRRIPGPHPGPDLDIGLPLLAKLLPDAGNRRLEVLADVVGEGLQRRNINDLRLILEPAIDALPDEVVDCGHEGGQSFARTGRGRDQHITASLDERPRLCLRRRRRH